MARDINVKVVTEGIIGPSIQSFGPIPGEDVLGGLAITGFVEVEKTLSFINYSGEGRTIFLEKKLPFQILILDIDPNEVE